MRPDNRRALQALPRQRLPRPLQQQRRPQGGPAAPPAAPRGRPPEEGGAGDGQRRPLRRRPLRQGAGRHLAEAEQEGRGDEERGRRVDLGGTETGGSVGVAVVFTVRI